jgi:hypothetical protein
VLLLLLLEWFGCCYYFLMAADPAAVWAVPAGPLMVQLLLLDVDAAAAAAVGLAQSQSVCGGSDTWVSYEVSSCAIVLLPWHGESAQLTSAAGSTSICCLQEQELRQ